MSLKANSSGMKRARNIIPSLLEWARFALLGNV